MAENNVNIPPTNHVKVLGGQGWIGLVDRLGTETSIVNAARVSFGKIRTEMDDRDAALVRYLIKNHHTSPLEHVVFTFLVHCPLFIRSQWHRHRTWSYNEISRRYTDVDIEFYTPPELREQAESDRQASRPAEHLDQAACKALIEEHHKRSLDLYHKLLEQGVCREQARGVLPQDMMTTFWATVDLNNLLKFLELRDSDHAQWEIREYAIAIKKLIKPDFPHVAEIKGW
ncbi:MAG: FAD-dependent thymidylate synthase [Lentisphaeria bacterium]|jgi:thymidylate synthase (FAD)|nr:FAD-dependent thymidylate synthase [Victivallales bacterium]MCR4575306.1 FAD-dependent thymidylate synthase [Lentisphaeria bacterium]MBP5673520.1 FAD-dependent thymidylate synthase [Victivallales bacterium]MBR3652142.1 FAD-dependent thymidylate synthase [Victivallales bacterium]MBR6059543.1 FAD-dependent thymidylate synthase [Victivallales bacterium]